MVPELMLLGFAAWTLMLLLTTVGAYRLSRVLRGRAGMSEFRADHVEGQDWYQRSMRAHVNCVENLPVFAVLVYALRAFGIADPAVDLLCVVILAARIPQSLVHVCFAQTDRVVSVRFAFFLVQFLSFCGLIALIAWIAFRR
ncbi:MAG: MAPEG family protein [Variovorax sp.]|nr:MAG: MAPEG family protein [Variovorax sp.]